jgi:hypothetical protein
VNNNTYFHADFRLGQVFQRDCVVVVIPHQQQTTTSEHGEREKSGLYNCAARFLLTANVMS